MNTYPLFFEPVFKERIWGGTRLRDMYGYDIPNSLTGEAWVISDHPHGRSLVRNGVLAGKTLDELMKEHPEFFGTGQHTSFPLLVKVLDARTDLSVQVHPDDEYAFTYEKGERGKTEAWLVLAAEPGAKIVYGHRATDREQLKRMVEQGQWQDLLVEVPVQAGDFFFVPSGCLHALGAGVVVLEIQQSSDTTYRVYDYDRVDKEGNKRELHLEKALEVTTCGKDFTKTVPEVSTEGKNKLYRYISCPYFSISRWEVNGTFDAAVSPDSFMLLSVLDGEGHISWSNGESKLGKGDHLFLPATLGEFKLDGQLDVVVATV